MSSVYAALKVIYIYSVHAVLERKGSSVIAALHLTDLVGILL